MLSDEEKKAFQYYKECNEKDLENYEYLDEVSQKQAKYLEILLNLIENQSNEIEELKKYEKYYEEMEEVNKKFLPVAKIKAKIEELEKEQEDNRKDLYNAVNNLYFKKIDIISNRIFVNMSIKDILQSLLNEEE